MCADCSTAVQHIYAYQLTCTVGRTGMNSSSSSAHDFWGMVREAGACCVLWSVVSCQCVKGKGGSLPPHNGHRGCGRDPQTHTDTNNNRTRLHTHARTLSASAMVLSVVLGMVSGPKVGQQSAPKLGSKGHSLALLGLDVMKMGRSVALPFPSLNETTKGEPVCVDCVMETVVSGLWCHPFPS